LRSVAAGGENSIPLHEIDGVRGLAGEFVRRVIAHCRVVFLSSDTLRDLGKVAQFALALLLERVSEVVGLHRRQPTKPQKMSPIML
jgi:hypothetical protein